MVREYIGNQSPITDAHSIKRYTFAFSPSISVRAVLRRSSRPSCCCHSPRTRPSDTIAVPEDRGLCRLAWHQPDIERVPLEHRHVAALFPTAQRHNAAVHLLPRGEIDIPVLIEVLAVALGRNVVMPG